MSEWKIPLTIFFEKGNSSSPRASGVIHEFGSFSRLCSTLRLVKEPYRHPIIFSELVGVSVLTERKRIVSITGSKKTFSVSVSQDPWGKLR